ncbi:Dynein heavy chain [Balamuthia mandrillaris]
MSSYSTINGWSLLDFDVVDFILVDLYDISVNTITHPPIRHIYVYIFILKYSLTPNSKTKFSASLFCLIGSALFFLSFLSQLGSALVLFFLLLYQLGSTLAFSLKLLSFSILITLLSSILIFLSIVPFKIFYCNVLSVYIIVFHLLSVLFIF